MDDCVTKPLLLEELAAAVERWTSGGPHPGPHPSSVSATPTTEGSNQEPVLDGSVLARLRDEIGDDGVSRFVATFLVELPGRLLAMREAVVGDDADALRAAAHALRSPSAAVGAQALAAACRRLEELGAAGDLNGARAPSAALEEIGRETARLLAPEADEADLS
jgi:HPt (histidine-containing phosphotransfer) domain-containing protein